MFQLFFLLQGFLKYIYFSVSAGLPALVVGISVGFTKAKGYGTVN